MTLVFMFKLSSFFENNVTANYKCTVIQSTFTDPLTPLESSSLKYWVWLTGFFSSLNWIFLPAVACKNYVWNRLKVKFIKLDISKWRIAKIVFFSLKFCFGTINFFRWCEIFLQTSVQTKNVIYVNPSAWPSLKDRFCI